MVGRQRGYGRNLSLYYAHRYGCGSIVFRALLGSVVGYGIQLQAVFVHRWCKCQNRFTAFVCSQCFVNIPFGHHLVIGIQAYGIARCRLCAVVCNHSRYFCRLCTEHPGRRMQGCCQIVFRGVVNVHIV